MLGKSEYKLWKLEKDENTTDTVLTEIDTSHTKLNTPYFTGSFDFTSDIGSKILISYKDTNRVAIVSALPGEKYSQAKVNVLNVISGQTLENTPEYNMLALDIDKIYTEPATGIVYNFAGLSKDKEGHKKTGTDVPIKQQMILYNVYEPAKTDDGGSDNTPQGNINDIPDNTSDNHAENNKNYSKDKKIGDSKSDGVYSSSSSTNSLSKIIYAHKSAAETEGGKWISLDNDRKKWAFELKDKSRIKRAWADIKDASGAVNTYCFDENGVMQIGWITHESGIWYFLESQDEKMLGSLKKGWYYDNNDKYRYYLNPQTGVMERGWQMINNKWYYFSEVQRNLKYNNETGKKEYYPQKPYGSMYINEKTPDNYIIGNDGSLIRN